jgi:hypothetical protein
MHGSDDNNLKDSSVGSKAVAKRRAILGVVLGLSVLLPLIFNQCGPAVFSRVSRQEVETLTPNPFVAPPVPFDPNGTSLDDGLDNGVTPSSASGSQIGDSTLPTENLRIDDPALLTEWVKNCGPEKFQSEKAEAIALAKANRNLVPVQYSISFGTVLDDTAWYAHRRAILHKDDDGITPVMVGPHNSLAEHNNANTYHYFADHTLARRQFIKGERCYFSVIDVSDPSDNNPDRALRRRRGLPQPVRRDTHASCQALDSSCNDQPYVHGLNVLYYGDLYPTDQEQSLSPRLFKKLGNLGRDEVPQIIPLYVADFREPLFGIPETEGPLIRPGFTSSAIRRHEYAHCLRDILDMPLLWRYRWSVTWDLSKQQGVCTDCKPCERLRRRGISCNRNFDLMPGMEGVPQLLQNIFMASMDGVILPLQYTPIILDLGRRGIVTSSMEWGTFFNLNKQTVEIKRARGSFANERLDYIEPLVVPGPHLTAWVGGRLINQHAIVPFGTEFKSNWVRKAEDGFLVSLDNSGTVRSGQHLFGDHTVVDGETFNNGFLALRKLARKKCNSDDIKDRYLGPWDTDLYERTLRVWVDANRNGISEPSELQSLRSVRVGALNTCYVEHRQDRDAFGNRTDLRAAFLYLANGEDVTNEQIIERIKTGKMGDGKPAEFRAAIDVFFRSMPNMTLLPKVLLVDPR